MSESSKYLLLGSGAHFTYQVLQHLLQRYYPPLAYVQHGTEAQLSAGQFADIPVENNIQFHPIPALLQHHALPFYYHQGLDLPEFIQHSDIDFILVACWPRLISNEIIRSVNCAALNLHPSLLPAFRGVDPIRAQLEAQHEHFGVSLHLLNDAYDCGDIVLQQSIEITVPTYRSIESACATRGADLFIQALQTYSKPGWTLIKQGSFAEK
jgi:methionyl-tRNA formyltransferase